MTIDDANKSCATEGTATTHVVRPAAREISLDDVLSAIRTLLRSDQPLTKRSRLRVVGGEAMLPEEAAQTTRLPVKS